MDDHQARQAADAILDRYLALPPNTASMVRHGRLHKLKPLGVPAVEAVSARLPLVGSAVQRADLADVLRHLPAEEASQILVGLLDDPKQQVRLKSVQMLRLMTRRVRWDGWGRRGKLRDEFEPAVEGRFDALVHAARDKDAQVRTAALYALADTRDERAPQALRRHLMDADVAVRFTAACLLTEFGDDWGANELEAALTRLKSRDDRTRYFKLPLLFGALERISGVSLGDPPANPLLMAGAANTRRAEAQHDALLERWTVWWRENRARR